MVLEASNRKNWKFPIFQCTCITIYSMNFSKPPWRLGNKADRAIKICDTAHEYPHEWHD